MGRQLASTEVLNRIGATHEKQNPDEEAYEARKAEGLLMGLADQARFEEFNTLLRELLQRVEALEAANARAKPGPKPKDKSETE